MRFIASALLAALLTGGLAGAVQAQEVQAARQIRFTPARGTAWMVEASAGGTAWHDIAGPFFGTGRNVQHFLPGGAEGLRLRYIDPATVGLAPLHPAGLSFQLDHQGKLREVLFLDDENGLLRLDDDHARTFTAAWTKSAADEIEAVLSGADGSFTLLRLFYTAKGAGRWGMEDIPGPQAAATVGRMLDEGGFAQSGQRPARGDGSIKAPTDLSGRRMVLAAGGEVRVLEFQGADTVTLRRGTEAPQTGTYGYDPADDVSGVLHLDVGGSSSTQLLSMNSSSTGSLRAPGSTLPPATFAMPEAPAEPLNEECPPRGIAGRSFIFADSTPCTLTFYANGEGVQRKEVNGVARVTHFRYRYSLTGGDKASVAVTFPGAAGDMADEYDLEFDDDCSGNYKRSSFTGGTRTSGRESNFRPAP
jgi:hypothetical protein